jgi:16S rRNA (guanine527-N7)-methyltransferase
MREAPDAPFGPEEFAAAANVSRETLARLKTYAAMLEDWNARHNLVAQSTMNDIWRRHFWDSAQLVPLIPETAVSLADLGSGAGFPGLVLAELLKDRKRLRVVLYEATGKKCQFLETVASRLTLDVQVRQARIEGEKPQAFDVIVARALAPLPSLLEYAQRFWANRTIGLFLKGQNVDAELTDAHKSWKFDLERLPSASDPSGVILKVTDLSPCRQSNRRPPLKTPLPASSWSPTKKAGSERQRRR